MYEKVQARFRVYQVTSILSYLILVLTGWCFFAVLPSLVFSSIEGWSYGESLYFAVVTLTTIGFGDYVPAMQRTYSARARMAYDVCFSVWLFVGMAYISLLLTQIGGFFTAIEDKIVQLIPYCQKFEDAFGKYAQLSTAEEVGSHSSNEVQDATNKDERVDGSPQCHEIMSGHEVSQPCATDHLDMHTQTFFESFLCFCLGLSNFSTDASPPGYTRIACLLYTLVSLVSTRLARPVGCSAVIPLLVDRGPLFLTFVAGSVTVCMLPHRASSSSSSPSSSWQTGPLPPPTVLVCSLILTCLVLVKLWKAAQ